MVVTTQNSGRQVVLSRLIQRTASSDWQAFSMLYSMTSPQVYGLMLSMTNYSNACEDLLQEVYLTVWRKAEGYQPDKAAVTTWLSTIARNRTLDWIRSQATKTDRQNLSPDEVAVELSGGNTDPCQWAEERLENSALQACLDHLSAEQRNAIMLAYFEGNTHAELAQRLQSALGTVKSWVRRGLQSLKICLQAGGDDS